MVFMQALKGDGSAVMNEKLQVTCLFSVYYFALGYRIGVEFKNKTIQLQPGKPVAMGSRLAI
jgi:hypothetical protein